ncbi:MAG TPA: methyltransferase [bacterium]|nr:methyltransferase [bacterium]
MSERSGRPDTTRLQRLARAYCETAVLYAALDLELFTRVARGADTEPALAAALGITPLNTERIVTACVALGLLERDGERLRNAPDVVRFGVRGEPGYAGPWLRFTRPDVPEWFRLGEHLRNQAPPRTLGKYDTLSVEQARAYHEATYSIGMGAGRRFARQVDLAGRRCLLDLGGGSGAYSIAATAAYPGLRAVVFDLPPVVEVAREFIATNGATGRVDVMAGDFTRDAFPTDCDAVVMASNLPIYNEETIQLVVRKTHDALLPGGEMHLVGEMLDDDRRGPLDPALWGLSEVIHGSAGKAHTVGQVQGYFRAAGFQAVAATPFVPGVLTRVSGNKGG